MSTLRDRVVERDHATFVGRSRELALFEKVLSGEVPHQVVHVTGPSGIGKSSLLREVARRAEARHWRSVWIEGRGVGGIEHRPGQPGDLVHRGLSLRAGLSLPPPPRRLEGNHPVSVTSTRPTAPAA